MLGAVAWEPHADLDLAEWVEHGRRLGGAGRSCGWWIGDWLRYGNERFGERYTRASNATGLDVQTLMNMVYVASHVDVSRRRETLSWSHHAELAALSVEQQEHWLMLAETHKWSVRDMRTEIRNARHASNANEGEALAGEAATSPANQSAHPGRESTSGSAGGTGYKIDAIVCPRCGYEIGSAA